jgi:hypothetical protein
MRFVVAIFCIVAAGAQQREEFSLALVESHSYHQGELIRAEVKFPSVPAGQPPQERWRMAGILLNPTVGCGSLKSPCLFQLGASHAVTGLMNPIEESGPRVISLNNYLPVLPPRHYQASVLARKLVLTSSGPMSVTYLFADPPQYTQSNPIDFDVVAASPEWINQTIAASVAKLRTAQPEIAAAEQLRFLDCPTAWRASLDLLPVAEGTLLEGLAETHEPARVCELMRTAMTAPSQAVSRNYLWTMSRTCARAKLPPASNASLAASLASKEGEKRTVAFETLLELVQQTHPPPEWTPMLKSEFVKSYATIETSRQRQLLSMYASTLRSPEIVPLLESVLDGWKPGDYFEAEWEAIQNLYQIDPVRAQARIVSELKRDRTWLDSSQLDLLPVGAAHITDDELFETLAAAERGGGWNVALRMTALAKYATPAALTRVKAIYESQENSCQPELMAYFVRVDPPYADRIFHSHAWDMQTRPPQCTLQYFQITPRIATGPVLEKYISAYLMNRDVFTKKIAARSLGESGSPAALEALWGAFHYFHNYWDCKQAELERNNEGVELEMDLRNAIVRGRHWITTESDLRLIESTCVSERCLNETQENLRARQRSDVR